MICQHDALLRLSHHGPVNCRLVRIIRSESVFSVGAVDSDKGLVKKCLTDILLRHISNQSEPIAAETPAGHRDFYFRQVAKLHSDVNRIGHYRQALAMADG